MPTIEAERPNGDTRSFSAAEIERGDLLEWGTANDPNADVTGVLLNKGERARTPPAPAGTRPLVIKDGALQLDMNAPTVLFDGADDGYVYDVQDRLSWTIALRTSVRGRGRQVIAHADGLSVVYEDLSVRAELEGTGGSETLAVDNPAMPARIVAMASSTSLKLVVNGEQKQTAHSLDRAGTGKASVGQAPGGADPLRGLVTEVEITPTYLTPRQVAAQLGRLQVPSIPLKDRSLPLTFQKVTAEGDGDYMELGDPPGEDLLVTADAFDSQVIELVSRSGLNAEKGTFLNRTYQTGILKVNP
jgi:hypothetical protein